MTRPILVVRLGAMGDIIHALPAVASLKASWPDRSIAWVVAPRWIPLLAGNPAVDKLIPFDRRSAASLRNCWSTLRRAGIDTAVDFQGLVQSALIGRAARPKQMVGFDWKDLREPAAGLFYHRRIAVQGPHRVDRNLQLVQALGANRLTESAWIPPGREEGLLPRGAFVLTTPFAGWAGKEWPLHLLDELGARLQGEGIELVANVSATRACELEAFPHLRTHISSLPGLIAAVRSAAAVVAPDSGPLHLAAALGKPGVALFGPTDPLSHGPFGNSLSVLRASGFETTYKRDQQTHKSMKAIRVEDVFRRLLEALSRAQVQARA